MAQVPAAAPARPSLKRRDTPTYQTTASALAALNERLSKPGPLSRLSAGQQGGSGISDSSYAPRAAPDDDFARGGLGLGLFAGVPEERSDDLDGDEQQPDRTTTYAERGSLCDDVDDIVDAPGLAPAASAIAVGAPTRSSPLAAGATSAGGLQPKAPPTSVMKRLPVHNTMSAPAPADSTLGRGRKLSLAHASDRLLLLLRRVLAIAARRLRLDLLTTKSHRAGGGGGTGSFAVSSHTVAMGMPPQPQQQRVG